MVQMRTRFKLYERFGPDENAEKKEFFHNVFAGNPSKKVRESSGRNQLNQLEYLFFITLIAWLDHRQEKSLKTAVKNYFPLPKEG